MRVSVKLLANSEQERETSDLHPGEGTCFLVQRYGWYEPGSTFPYIVRSIVDSINQEREHVDSESGETG